MSIERLLIKDGRLRPALRCVVFVVAALCAFVVIAMLLMIAVGVTPSSLLREAVWISIGSETLAFVGVAVLLRTSLDRRSVASLGLAPRAGWLRLLLLGVFLGAGMQLVVLGLDIALHFTSIVRVSLAPPEPRALALWLVLFILAALAEEMALRGYILQNLWEDLGFVAATVITSLLFAVVHLWNPNVPGHVLPAAAIIAADGVWACLAVLWTRSLWLALGAHIAWNLFEGPVLGAPVSGLQFQSSIVTQSLAGPGWFTGGAFGPEAGASGAIALAAGLAVLYWLYRAGAFKNAPDLREAYARDVAKTSEA